MEPLDLSAFQAVPFGEKPGSLSKGFPQAAVVVHAGKNLSLGSQDDDRIDLVMFEVDRPETRSHTYVSVTLYATDAAASARFDAECVDLGEDFTEDGLRITKTQSDWSCVSAVAQLRNDPEGGCFPSNEYYSFVTLKKGRLVVHAKEHFYGPADSGGGREESVRAVTQGLARIAGSGTP